MKKSMRMAVALAGLGLGLGAAVVHAQIVKTSASASTSGSAGGGRVTVDPWRESMDAFAAEDRASAPKPGGVLFVGSSSIRLWNDLEKQFGVQTEGIVKRGFGGSSMNDVVDHIPQLVLPYKPRLIVVYAGDNDLAEGRSPQDVLQSFEQFVQLVREQLPDTRIAYLSIKPSPSREALMLQARKTNKLIAAYVATGQNLDYIDVYSKMLSADGRPRPELFGPDMLHLNDDGYAIWKGVIADHLRPQLQSAQAASR